MIYHCEIKGETAGKKPGEFSDTTGSERPATRAAAPEGSPSSALCGRVLAAGRWEALSCGRPATGSTDSALRPGRRGPGLDQIWNAYEHAEALDMSALPALQVRSRMTKHPRERGIASD